MHHFYNTECGRVATSFWGGYFCIHWLGEYCSLGSHKQVNIFDLDSKARNSDSVSYLDIIETVIELRRESRTTTPFLHDYRSSRQPYDAYETVSNLAAEKSAAK